MKLVSIQSPYAGDIGRNLAYARRALCESLKRGEAPFASHLLYTQVLDDEMCDQRSRSLDCDYAFLAKCDYVAFYADYGFSKGMVAAFDKAHELNIPITIRHMGISDDNGHAMHDRHPADCK